MRPARGLLVVALFTVGMSARASQRVVRRDERGGRAASDMVLVPAGTFLMGTDSAEQQRLREACYQELSGSGTQFCDIVPQLYAPAADPLRQVYVSAFEIDRYEVTTAKYRACVAAGWCEMQPLVTGDTRFLEDEWPMVNLTHGEAATYCQWRGKRLPTEAEWEKAARGDDGRRWPWGAYDRVDGANLGAWAPEVERDVNIGFLETAVDETDGARLLAPPGTFSWGRSPYGVEDLGGNASEWVADWYAETGYEGLTTIDPTGAATGSYRAVRGGSYYHPRMFGLAYMRQPVKPEERSITRGFRCARDAANP